MQTLKHMATPARAVREQADAIKRNGAHYTPEALACFVSEQAWGALSARKHARVLDPACGDGALLEAVIRAAPADVRLDVVGFDTDEDAVALAHQRLAPLVSMPHSLDFHVGNYLEAASTEKPGTLFSDPPRDGAACGFDLVIANPPYVRTQVLGASRAQELAKTFGISGRVDLYHAFVLAMTASLSQGGVLGLISSNRFLTTRTGCQLRRHLASEYELRTVYDLGDTKLFSAAVLPAVVIGVRSSAGSDGVEITSVYERRDIGESPTSVPEFATVLEALSDSRVSSARVGTLTYSFTRGSVAGPKDADSPWVASESRVLPAIAEAARSTFADHVKIRVGIKTTADSVFIREDWSALDESIRPESDLLLPLLTHHSAARWQPAEPSRFVLYPYDLTQLRRVPLDLRDWPRTAAYLEEHRERLAGRKYVLDGGRAWWEIWVPQRPSAWSGPKIVFPDICEAPRFSIDRSGAVVNGDCYWIPFSESDNELACLMVAVANSSLGIEFYDGVCGNKLYAGRRRYITQYVQRFPLPDLHTRVAQEIAAQVDTLTRTSSTNDQAEVERDIDRLVWRSFGLEKPTR